MFYSADQYIYEWVCNSVKEELKSRKDNDLTWTLNQQIAFFMSMFGLKPVGVNRHFMMLCLHHKFSTSIDAEVSSKVLWDELDTLYDMAALHESEIIPFPNDEVDFELPKECHDLFKSKYGITYKTNDSAVKSRLRNTDSYKLLRKLKASRMKQFIPVAVTNKSLRSPLILKNEATPKAKQEPLSSVKPAKDKHSSSPFPGIKPESSEISGKKTRPERSTSPSPHRKPVKSDTSNPTSSTRKQTKETTPVASRSTKEQTPDSLKKMKADKESSVKKSKTVQSSDTISSRKSSTKLDVDLKTRSDYAGSMRKKSESSSVKSSRTESKSQESDASSLSGTRKSSSSVKGKNIDSNKKVKTSRLEESSKKVTPGPKRRRIT